MIPGITDRTRIPRLGKIRLGEKATSGSGNPYPKATSYFVMKDAPGLDDLDLPERPTSLPIRFLSDRLDEVFATSRSAYGKGTGLFCRCTDGETAVRVWIEGGRDKHGAAFLKEQGHDEPTPGEMYELPCEGDECPYMKAKRCSNLGRLHFEVIGQSAWGVYEINTTSYHSIVNVYTALQYALTEFGQLRKIPFALRLVPKDVTPEGKRKTVYILQLVPPQRDLVEQARGRKLLDTGGKEAPKLEAPDDTPDDLYPNGGETLDADLWGEETAGTAAGEDGAAVDTDPTEGGEGLTRAPEAPPSADFGSF